MIAIPAGMTLLSACTTLPPAPAAGGYLDTAEVIRADPLYQPVQVRRPVSECWTERVPRVQRAHAGYVAPVVGGIIGGVLGNRVASGGARMPMTVAGSLVGASIGHNLGAAHYRPPVVDTVRRCRTLSRYEQRQQLVGYRVDYRYEGQTFTTRSPRHPGRFIRVRVDVEPVGGT
jgi:uncharacterized protein YcfJ